MGLGVLSILCSYRLVCSPASAGQGPGSEQDLEVDPLPGTCDRLDKAQAVQGGDCATAFVGAEGLQVGSRQTTTTTARRADCRCLLCPFSPAKALSNRTDTPAYGIHPVASWQVAVFASACNNRSGRHRRC